jgi:hypothetical protein
VRVRVESTSEAKGVGYIGEVRSGAEFGFRKVRGFGYEGERFVSKEGKKNNGVFMPTSANSESKTSGR